MTPTPRAAASSAWSAWQVVLGFGVVSLTVDLVADGAKSIAGPLLGELGANALTVGLVTGSAEAIGFILRLLSGPAVDRSRRYWAFTIGGYALTGLCVPLLAITPWLGAAGLGVAAALILTERAGKAIRSPAKTVLLSHAAHAVGRGQGFAVHKTLDQVGAFLGPLLVAAVIALTGALWPAFAALALPALVALVVLFWMRRSVPDPSVYEPQPVAPPSGATAASASADGARAGEAPANQARAGEGPGNEVPTSEARASEARAGQARTAEGRGGIPVTVLLFSLSTALTTFGLVGFGIISFHLSDREMIPVAAVPLVFSVGMVAAAVAALASGRLYDRMGAAVLLAVPVLVVAIPALTLSSALGAVIVGVALWGAATGIQDSTVKALLADLVPAGRRGTAYGVFAVFQGAGTFAGAAVAGLLYPDAAALSLLTVPAQALALLLLLVVVARRRRALKAEAASAPTE
ncbi:hypothetical protein BH09ACT3_BH09ACT3_13630 [soil metagenome]